MSLTIITGDGQPWQVCSQAICYSHGWDNATFEHDHPIQHQPPTNQTFPISILPLLLSEPIRLRLDLRISGWQFSLLLGVRNTLVNLARCKTFAVCIGFIGQVVTQTEEGCSCIDSVMEELEHMYIGWARVRFRNWDVLVFKCCLLCKRLLHWEFWKSRDGQLTPQIQ